jgi:hypothetical protein
MGITYQGRKKESAVIKLISVSVTIAFLAVGSGKLPWILFQVRKAQIQLIKDSQASKWPKAMTLNSAK